MRKILLCSALLLGVVLTARAWADDEATKAPLEPTAETFVPVPVQPVPPPAVQPAKPPVSIDPPPTLVPGPPTWTGPTPAAPPVLQAFGTPTTPDQLRGVTLDVVAVLLAAGPDGKIAGEPARPAGMVADQIVEAVNESSDAPDVLPLLAKLGALEDVELLYNVRLATLVNQKVRATSGKTVHTVTGVQLGPRGMANSTRAQELGIRLQATPRVASENALLVELSFEASCLGPEEEGTTLSTDSEGKTVRMPGMNTIVIETTLVARNGQTVVVHRGLRGDGPKTRLLLVLVKPRLDPVEPVQHFLPEPVRVQ
ncbi:MAG: hypothetical protein JW809_01250 [Pirellulales bacterium]|nr:hypothetical protein [Pirellulales bacterium]